MTIVAWDFDGVLNRNVVGRRFIWMDEFEADTGHCPDVFSHHVFGDDFAPVMKGHEDLRDRVARWAENVGYEPGPDAFLRYWFEKDVDPDPILLALMDRLDDQGVRQVIVTNNDPRRGRFIEEELGFGQRVEKFFTAGRMGVVKPSLAFFEQVTMEMRAEPGDMYIVDDFKENVDGAVRAGWNAMHFTEHSRAGLEDFLPLC